MANNLVVIPNSTDMAAGVPIVNFTAQIDDGRSCSSGAPIPWGSTLVAANLALINAAKAACISAMSNPVPVFDGTSKEILVGGILSGTGL